MSGVLGVDLGGSSVKSWISTDDPSRARLATVAVPLDSSPEEGLVEFDPQRWWALICEAVKRCIEVSDRPAIRAVVISSIRQAFLLCDASGEIGPGIHNADRRGAVGLEMLGRAFSRDEIHDLTGHWSAPQMPLPKLLAIREGESERWARTSRLMFVQDWVAWRLTGVWKNERTLATSSQLCDVRTGTWATGLLASLGLRDDMFGEIIDAGDVVGTSGARTCRTCSAFPWWPAAATRISWPSGQETRGNRRWSRSRDRPRRFRPCPTASRATSAGAPGSARVSRRAPWRWR